MDAKYSGLIFQGKNSRDLGFTVQYPFNLVHPTADLDATHIKGRNGDFLQDDNSYQNVTETFTINVVRPTNVSQFDYERQLTDWLAPPAMQTERKYQYRQVDYDPEYAYSAIQKDPFSGMKVILTMLRVRSHFTVSRFNIGLTGLNIFRCQILVRSITKNPEFLFQTGILLRVERLSYM